MPRYARNDVKFLSGRHCEECSAKRWGLKPGSNPRVAQMQVRSEHGLPRCARNDVKFLPGRHCEECSAKSRGLKPGSNKVNCPRAREGGLGRPRVAQMQVRSEHGLPRYARNDVKFLPARHCEERFSATKQSMFGTFQDSRQTYPPSCHTIIRVGTLGWVGSQSCTGLSLPTPASANRAIQQSLSSPAPAWPQIQPRRKAPLPPYPESR